MAEDNNQVSRSSSSVQGNESTHSVLKQMEDSLKTIINPLTQLITVSLDENNFLLRKFQIETAIRGYGLQDFIDGTTSVPPKFIADPEGKLITNPEFNTYQRQDNLLCAWLLSSISPNLLSQVIGCRTSNEVWMTMKQNFSSRSSARIMHHKRQLQCIKKENMTIREYLSKIKTLCDLLESAGHKVTESEHILTILNGLDNDYEAIVAVISSQETPPSLQHVHSVS